MGVRAGVVAGLVVRCPAQLLEQAGGEFLERPANPVFAGERHCEPGGQQCAQKGRGRHG